MNTTLKKLLVILPVTIIASIYLRELYHDNYNNTSFKRVAGFVLSVLILFGWITFVTIRRKQDSFFAGSSPFEFLYLCFCGTSAHRLLNSFQRNLVPWLVGQNESPDRNT